MTYGKFEGPFAVPAAESARGEWTDDGDILCVVIGTIRARGEDVWLITVRGKNPSRFYGASKFYITFT